MDTIRIPSKYAFIFSLIAFSIAALSISGVILKTDLTGQVFWCSIWCLVGIAWLTGLVHARRKETNTESFKDAHQDIES